MKNSIFQQLDYKAYLRSWIAAQPSRGHGTRRGMALAIGCQTAFISQMLNGQAQLSLEQADRLNPFLGHSKEESEFFLLLVQHTRAGTESLRKHFHSQLRSVLEKRSVLKERLSSTHELSNEDRSVFFSSWCFAAAHVLLSIPGQQTKVEIAKTLQLPLDRVGDILEFLVARGLAERKGERFSVGPMHIHLGNDSPMIARHHMNWRAKALQYLDQEEADDLHYSSVVSVSRDDAKRIKAILADSLAAARATVAESREEELYSICLDFFRVGRG